MIAPRFRPAVSRALHSTIVTTTNASMAVSKLRYLLVLDFEATCGDAVKQKEIIEFPTLLYDMEESTCRSSVSRLCTHRYTEQVKATFHEYVRPEIHTTLTPFCTELTGITQVCQIISFLTVRDLSGPGQETVDKADTFPVVWKRYEEFMRSHGLLDPDTMDTHAFLTCGDWDLKTMLPEQLALVEPDHGLDAQGKPIAPYSRWINIKQSFKKHVGLMRMSPSMTWMLQRLKLELVGRHHSGIDDCKNILRLAEKMREEGWEFSNAQVRSA